MAQILVRGLEDAVKTQLEERARRHGRSTVEEVREILRNAVLETHDDPRGLGTRIATRFRGLELDEGFAEMRGQEARPARFEP